MLSCLLVMSFSPCFLCHLVVGPVSHSLALSLVFQKENHPYDLLLSGSAFCQNDKNRFGLGVCPSKSFCKYSRHCFLKSVPLKLWNSILQPWGGRMLFTYTVYSVQRNSGSADTHHLILDLRNFQILERSFVFEP